MSAPAPRHLRARSRRLSTPLRWLLSLALLTPLVAGLAGASGVASTPAAQAAPGSSAGAAVRFALAQLGKPYRWGAEGPNSFDCSGLVQTSYRSAGVDLPRVSRQQYGGRQAHPAVGLARRGPALLRQGHLGPADHLPRRHVPGRRADGGGAQPEGAGPDRLHLAAGAARQGHPAGRGMLLVEAGERSRAVAAVQHR